MSKSNLHNRAGNDKAGWHASWISGDTVREKAHRKSFERLLGTRYEQLLESVSLEERVTKDTPQTFLWHTVTDGAVPVENSMLFAQALQKRTYWI